MVDQPRELESGAKSYGDLSSSDGFEPRHIAWLRLLWEQRRFLGRVTAYGLVLSIIVAFILRPRYDSVTRLMPPDGQSGSSAEMMALAAQTSLASTGGLGEKLTGMAGSLLGLKTSGALFIDILRSRTVEDRLIQRFDLRKVYWHRYWDDTRKQLEQNTGISEDRKSGVITITVTDRDPHRAQEIAQAYVEELDRLVAEVSNSSARRERIFIEQRLKTVKQDLDSASKQFSEYASKNTAIDISAQGKASVEAAARLQGELIAAQSELEGLAQIYTDNNVRVRSLRARVEELQRQLHKIGGNTSPSIPNDSNIPPEFPSIRELPLLEVRWADLYRQTKIHEAVYQMLVQQDEVAKIQEAKEIPTVKILDPADIPEKRSFPKRTNVMFLGTLWAFSMGLVFVVGSRVWKGVDPRSPEKRFIVEICSDLQGRFHSILGRKQPPE